MVNFSYKFVEILLPEIFEPSIEDRCMQLHELMHRSSIDAWKFGYLLFQNTTFGGSIFRSEYEFWNPFCLIFSCKKLESQSLGFFRSSQKKRKRIKISPKKLHRMKIISKMHFYSKSLETIFGGFDESFEKMGSKRPFCLIDQWENGSKNNPPWFCLGNVGPRVPPCNFRFLRYSSGIFWAVCPSLGRYWPKWWALFSWLSSWRLSLWR